MLEQLDLTPLSHLRKLLKLMYNIVHGILYIFPTGYFVQSHFLYCSNHVFNYYTRPFACIHANYLFSSFVPSAVSLWIAYQTMLKFLYFLLLRLMYHISMTAIHVGFCPFVTQTFHRKKRVLHLLSWVFSSPAELMVSIHHVHFSADKPVRQCSED